MAKKQAKKKTAKKPIPRSPRLSDIWVASTGRKRSIHTNEKAARLIAGKRGKVTHYREVAEPVKTIFYVEPGPSHMPTSWNK